jgi:hypothetical protein
MHDIELLSSLLRVQTRFSNLEWGLTKDLDWVEVEDSEEIYAFIKVTETYRICILVGHFRKFTLRVVFEYEEYTTTLKRQWSEDLEELLNNLEVWLQEIRSINKRYRGLSVKQLLEHLQEKFPKLSFVKHSIERYDLASLRFGKAPITIYGSLKIEETGSISMTIYEELLIRVDYKNNNRRTGVEKQKLEPEEELLFPLEEWLISMYLALKNVF